MSIAPLSLLHHLIAFEQERRVMARATDASECGNASQRLEEEAWRALETVGMRRRIEAKGVSTACKPFKNPWSHIQALSARLTISRMQSHDRPHAIPPSARGSTWRWERPT